MKRTYLEEADPHDVSAGLRRVLDSGGALVKEHVSTHVRFESLPPQRPAWRREGYVGIYQPYGDPDVEVRLILRARWPWRLLWGAAAVNVALFVLLLILQPSGSGWYLAAGIMALLLLVTGIVYLNTMHAVRLEERAWMEGFESELARAMPDAGLATSDAHLEREAMDDLEGKIAERRLAEARRNAPKPVKEKGESRFRLRPKKEETPEAEAKPAEAAEAPPAQERKPLASRFKFGKKTQEAAADETPEQKRARLLARKAELEAQQRQDPDEAGP